MNEDYEEQDIYDAVRDHRKNNDAYKRYLKEQAEYGKVNITSLIVGVLSIFLWILGAIKFIEIIIKLLK